MVPGSSQEGSKEIATELDAAISVTEQKERLIVIHR